MLFAVSGRWKCGCEVGDDVHHCPSCPEVRPFVLAKSKGVVPLWLMPENGSFTHFLLVCNVDWEDLLRTAIWQDVIMQAANALRYSSRPGGGLRALHTRLRTVLGRVKRAHEVVGP